MSINQSLHKPTVGCFVFMPECQLPLNPIKIGIFLLYTVGYCFMLAVLVMCYNDSYLLYYYFVHVMLSFIFVHGLFVVILS